MSLSSTDYALLAQDSYHDPVLNKPKELGGVAYEAIDVANNPLTGFQATAYRRMDTGEIVIAYRGTEFDREPVQDGGVDAGMVLTGLNLQRSDSEAFTERVLERAKLEADLHHRPMQVTVTGHSLGGTLAELNASKYGLKGETFNAYGAAGLREGVPEGGTQVIDHVRAGDLVSAASPHFGEVRIYAAQKDIDTLTHAGYRDDSGVLSPRNPIKATDFDAHAIDNFVPDSKLLGQSIVAPENQARYRAHEGMVDRYRNDVRDIRLGLSASWEIPKAIGEFKDAVEHRVAEAVEHGARAIEKGVTQVVHEAREGLDHLKQERSTWATASPTDGTPSLIPDHGSNTISLPRRWTTSPIRTTGCSSRPAKPFINSIGRIPASRMSRATMSPENSSYPPARTGSTVSIMPFSATTRYASTAFRVT